MIIYTIGFTQKTAKVFFETLKLHKIGTLIDIRLNNKSQLAGFTKYPDIEYLLKTICNIKYFHKDIYAPTKDLLSRYQKKQTSWNEYIAEYLDLMKKRRAVERFNAEFGDFDSVCLLCSEPTPEQCHRRLLAEMLSQESSDVKVVHL